MLVMLPALVTLLNSITRMHKKVFLEYSTAAATITDTYRYEVYVNSDNYGRRVRFKNIAENSGGRNRIRICAIAIPLLSHTCLNKAL